MDGLGFLSTAQAARRLGITPSSLSKAVWDGRVQAPAKGPNGSYLWTATDIERASWALLRRDIEDATKDVELRRRQEVKP